VNHSSEIQITTTTFVEVIGANLNEHRIKNIENKKYSEKFSVLKLTFSSAVTAISSNLCKLVKRYNTRKLKIKQYKKNFLPQCVKNLTGNKLCSHKDCLS
jgi:DNA primase large subunit